MDAAAAFPSLTTRQLTIAQAVVASHQCSLPHALSRLGLLSDAAIADALAVGMATVVVPRFALCPNTSLCGTLSFAWLFRHDAIAIERDWGAWRR